VSSTVTLSEVRPGTAAATRWRIEFAVLISSMPPARMTTEAVGCCSSRRKFACCGMTMWTRADLMPAIDWIVREISPSSARSRVTSCMKEVRPSEPTLSNSS
jgi:hypothetical protein